MRNRSQTSERDGTTGDTLKRLHDALGALEARVGTRAPQPSPQPRIGEAEAIRARMAALDGEAKRTGQLRDELSRLRRDVDRQMDAPVAGFDEIRNELRAMRAGSGDVGILRSEIEQLKGVVTSLAREESIRELNDRWSVIEREIAGMPDAIGNSLGNTLGHKLSNQLGATLGASLAEKLATHDDLVELAGRLDTVHEAVRRLPDHWHTGEIENQLRMLATAVEHLAGQSMQPTTVQLDTVEDRLDEISRAIATLSIPVAPAVPAVGIDAIERLEARMAALGRQIDDGRQPVEFPQIPDYRDHLNAIMARIEHIAKSDAKRNEAPAVAGFPTELMDGFAGRLDDIALAVEEIAHMQNKGEGVDAGIMLADLEDRFEAIAARLSAGTETARRTTEVALTSLDSRMEELARRIDETGREQQAVPSIANLEERLEEIAAMLSSGPAPHASTPGFDLERLEQRLEQLASGIAPVTHQAIDEEAIIAAARSAAEEVVARVKAGGLDMPDALADLTDDLRALEDLARDTDTRNSRTFEAIHDTLLKVVDHLASLEDSVSGMRAPAAMNAPAMAAPAFAAPRMDAPRFSETARPVVDRSDDFSPEPAKVMPAAKVQVADAPSIETELMAAIRHTSATPTPAEAAANAAFAALHVAGTTERSEAFAKPKRKASILEAVTRRLSRNAAPANATEAAQTTANMAHDPREVPVTDDLPIEPGADQMALADIMARVRAERAAPRNQSEDPSAKGSGVSDSDVGRSDFIAAARRAAKAAAADASIGDRASGRGKANRGKTAAGAPPSGRKFSIGRKPLLMGAGAILLALLALPLVRGFLAPAPIQTSLETSAPAAIIEQAPSIAAVTPDTPRLAVDSEAPEAAMSAPMSAETDLTTGAPAVESDAASEASLAVAPESTIDQGLEEVPEAAGPAALREAAAAGDPLALYVVAENLTAGTNGNAAGDLGAALTWYERSAELGFAPAQYRAGNFHEKGFGTPRDVETAKTWYQLAAEQGNASAMHNLAVLFASGVDGQPDYDSAARWFMSAAELGVRDSQFNLGILAAKGEGTAQDLAESYKWFALAAKSGDTDAAAKRDEVAAVLRPDQLEMARGAVELWRVKPIAQDVNTVTVPDEWRTDSARTASAPPLSPEDMKKAVSNIQAILNANGYDAGSVDGVMGQKTRDAIRAFQAENGLPVTGDVDQALGEKLLELAKKAP